MRVVCFCGKEMNLADTYAGKRVRCPGCGEPVQVPESIPRTSRDERIQSRSSRASWPAVGASVDGEGDERREDSGDDENRSRRRSTGRKANSQARPPEETSVDEPARPARSRVLRRGAVASLCVAVIAGSGYAIYRYSFAPETQQANVKVAAQVRKSEEVVAEWCRAFTSGNQEAWVKQHIGKVETVTGRVSKLGEFQGVPFVALPGGGLDSYLLCHFQHDSEEFRKLKIGHLVRLQGKVHAGHANSVHLREIEILEMKWSKPPNKQIAEGQPRPVLKLKGRAGATVGGSRSILDVNSPFTIDMRVRFEPDENKSYYFAATEAWPGMHPKTAFPETGGWVIRTVPAPGEGIALDFTIAQQDNPETTWMRTAGKPKSVPADTGFQHIAVCRSLDDIKIYWNGKLHASMDIRGKRFVQGISNVHIGPRRYGHKTRYFEGEIADFRLSQGVRFNGDFEPPNRFEVDEFTLYQADFSVGNGTRIPDLVDNNTAHIHSGDGPDSFAHWLEIPQ